MSSADVTASGDGVSQGKKRKIEADSSEVESTTCQSETSCHTAVLKDFKLIKVLREDDRHKFICLHGTLPNRETTESEIAESSGSTKDDNDKNEEQDEVGDSQKKNEHNAVVLLERKSFNVAMIEQCVQMAEAEETLQNDIYSTYDMFSGARNPDMKATVIFPATEKHIAKYSSHEPFIVHETPDLYKTVTLPCIEASKFSIQWVYNILEKKQEADRIVEEDTDPETGFVMVPDMKWDRKKLESLYLVAIVHKHGLRSLRDLRGEHLPLLKNILNKGVTAIGKLYNIGPDKLRIYFHYQPSYYHLHVHFTHLQFDAPGSDVMRAHLINDVINNLTLDSDFYAKKTLSYVVREGDNLYKWYSEKGYFDK